jgi:hypothetical protein
LVSLSEPAHLFFATPNDFAVDSSLYAEGTDGVRVLSTRYRTRAVKEGTRNEVRAKEMQIQTQNQDAER